jgi:hypothetical protein
VSGRFFQECSLSFQILILALELLQPDTFGDRELDLGATGGLAVLAQPVPESLSADAISGSDVLDGFRRGYDLAAQLAFNSWVNRRRDWGVLFQLSDEPLFSEGPLSEIFEAGQGSLFGPFSSGL